MNPLKAFARLLRIRDDQAEDALYNARAAKLVLSRRSFIGVGAALATGAAFGFYKQLEYLPWNDPTKLYVHLEDEHGCVYESVIVPRDAKHWEVVGDEANLLEPLAFPMGNGSKTMDCSRLRICGADGRALFSGPLNQRIYVGHGVTPVIEIRNLRIDSGPPGALQALVDSTMLEDYFLRA